MYLLCMGYEFSPALFCSGHLDAHKSACVALKVAKDRQHQQPSGSRQAEWCRLHQCITLSVRSEWQIQSGYPWPPFSCLILSPLITLNSVWKEHYCFKCDRKKIRMYVSTHPCLSQLAIWNSVTLVYSSLSTLPLVLSFPLAQEG